jgi:hypothetical protein
VAEWQTRRTQNPLVARPCGFDSLLRHQLSAESSFKLFLSSASHLQPRRSEIDTQTQQAYGFVQGRDSMENSHMKKPAIGLIVLLIMVGVGFAAQKDSTFSGEITDRYCAKANSHEMMMKRHNSPTTKQCIPDCVKAGGAYVLFDAATKTIYELDDQQKPARFAEQKVKITGTYDKAKQTIHVTDIFLAGSK